MWKILFITVLAAAAARHYQPHFGASCAVVEVGCAVDNVFVDANFELKGRQRQRLRMSLEEECEKYSHLSKADKIYNSVMTAVACLYTDKEVNKAFGELRLINSTETFLGAGKALCNQRHKIVPCYRVILEAFEPCAPPAVREQIDTMQKSFETLSDFLCLDDRAKLRKFAVDGGFDCVLLQDKALNPCTANMVDFTTELPEDTTTFAAIDACHKYDAMVTCFNEVLKSCPKESTLGFLNNIFTQFRQGTYCHITLPLEKNEDLTKETNNESAGSNVENNKL